MRIEIPFSEVRNPGGSAWIKRIEVCLGWRSGPVLAYRFQKGLSEGSIFRRRVDYHLTQPTEWMIFDPLRMTVLPKVLQTDLPLTFYSKVLLKQLAVQPLVTTSGSSSNQITQDVIAPVSQKDLAIKESVLAKAA